MLTIMTRVVLSAVIAGCAILAGGREPTPESSAAGPQFQVIDSTAECRAKFPTYLTDFGFNPFSFKGYEDPRPMEASAPEVLLKSILNATREWVVDERFDRCVSTICACVLKIPGREYAVHVSDCEETLGVIDHAVAMLYLSDPDIKRVDVVKWYTNCTQKPDPANDVQR